MVNVKPALAMNQVDSFIETSIKRHVQQRRYLHLVICSTIWEGLVCGAVFMKKVQDDGKFAHAMLSCATLCCNTKQTSSGEGSRSGKQMF